MSSKRVTFGNVHTVIIPEDGEWKSYRKAGTWRLLDKQRFLERIKQTEHLLKKVLDIKYRRLK